MFEPFCIACVMPVILPSRGGAEQRGPRRALSRTKVLGIVQEGYLNFMCLRNS